MKNNDKLQLLLLEDKPLLYGLLEYSDLQQVVLLLYMRDLEQEWLE